MTPWAPRYWLTPHLALGRLYILSHQGSGCYGISRCGAPGPVPCCPHPCPRPSRPSSCSAQTGSCRNARRWCTPCPSTRLTSSTLGLRAFWPFSQVSFLLSRHTPPRSFFPDLLFALCAPFGFIIPCAALSPSSGPCLCLVWGIPGSWACCTAALLRGICLPLSLPTPGPGHSL